MDREREREEKKEKKRKQQIGSLFECESSRIVSLIEFTVLIEVTVTYLNWWLEILA